MNDRPAEPLKVREARTTERIRELVASVGGDPASFDGRLVTEMIQTSLKVIPDGHDTGQLKLLTRAMKEMRYAYRVFNRYRGTRKISIFGSARTPEEHPDYRQARAFGAAMARAGWMCITGAGDGIMKAGHEGPRREASFGLSIRLPFETTANEVIEGDPKLINFRYFFTRKLMFMSHADAVVVFPGGYGTQDELFETLTLIQTGKSNPVPVVVLEGEGGVYWEHWDRYLRKNLLANGWVSEEDPGLYHRATSVEDAVDHVLGFYRVYHSSRYVGDRFVLRLQRPLDDAHLERLNEEFASLVATGRIEQGGPLEGEEDHLELPRLAFVHTRRHFGLLHALIDRINTPPGAAGASGGAEESVACP
ncbi:MAG: LOG family protein [Planctomycetota bacterium]|jgi:uncharacterized protein (TIGR00730 family)